MTNYKQLCAELHAALEKHDLSLADDQLLDRSAAALRAALAQPEPEGPKDSDLHALAFRFAQPCFDFDYIPFARAVLARWGNHPGSPDSSAPQPVPDPVAWMYQGEPSFDGTDWRETWEVTTDKRLAEFKATPDQPIPLFSIQLQPQ